MTIFRTSLMAVALSFILATPAHATFMDGNKLLNECTATKDETTYFQSQARCNGYIISNVDTITLLKTVGMTKAKYCVPNGVTAGQLVDIFIQYSNKHPENRHYDASIILIFAFREAFPCSDP